MTRPQGNLVFRCRASAAPGLPPSPARAFTIVELVISLGVIAMLCGILLPSLRATRESAQRIGCQSNQRQIGAALGAYGMTHNDALPPSKNAERTTFRPRELMAARMIEGAFDDRRGWDGLGLLVDGYIGGQCQCLHCGSHHGDHPYERYRESYADTATKSSIYANYHYSGHVDFRMGIEQGDAEFPRLSLHSGVEAVILSDGLRTRLDFNHRGGLNRMWADLSIEWMADTDDSLFNQLPASDAPEDLASAETGGMQLPDVWKQISDSSSR
jgi:type II secretory pathway pseudopilin PulG